MDEAMDVDEVSCGDGRIEDIDDDTQCKICFMTYEPQELTSSRYAFPHLGECNCSL